MTTKTCPACASSNPENASFCSQCGSPLDTGTEAVVASPPPGVEPEGMLEQPVAPVRVIVSEQPGTPSMVAEQPAEPVSHEMPCFVKLAGGFFGCLIGLIVGLCLSLICVLPVAYMIGGGGGSTALQFAIIVIIILTIVTTILGIISGPGFLGKILASIGDTFKWMTGSKK